MDGDLGALRRALPSYEIGAVLGRGAWGTIVSGHHRALNRAVAIKWLRAELVDDTAARARFNAEAQVLAALDHPHVVRVYDYVEVDEVCALVMERLPGGTIADRTRLGPLPQQAACAYAMAALHGLEHAHHHEVLHRDVKPENLMLASDGRLRVTDFGIAAIIGGNGQRLTQTGVALGTPAYMAPEQLADPDRIGTYTDVWSTAAVLYELLARQVPYEARSTLHATLLARATEDPRPLRDLVPDVPASVSEAVMRGLARDIEDRFPTCLDAADAIESAATDAWGSDWLVRTGIPLQRTPSRPRPAATGAVPVTPPPALADSDPAPTGAQRHSRRRRAGWLAAAALILVGGVVAAVTLSGGKSPSASATQLPGSFKGPAPRGLPALPSGWGDHLSLGVGLPDGTLLPTEFGHDAIEVYGYAGDPAGHTDFRSAGGADPAAAPVRDILASGATPYLYTYTLRTTGHPNDVSSQGQLAIMRNRTLMRAYWQSTTELLKELGTIKHTLFLGVDPSVPANVQSVAGNDPRSVATAVASSGVAALAGLPNNFAGWAQAWVRLRDSLAPNVRLGWCVDGYGVGNHFIPQRPSVQTLSEYEQSLKVFYAGLGTRFDYIDYTVGYGDGGKTGPDNMARPTDVTTMEHWVADMVAATHERVVLSAIPVGNTLMRAEDNKPYHYQDRWAQLILGDNATARAALLGLRNAGAIGLIFGYGYTSPDFTCACDAASDGVTNPKPTGTATQRSLSADDDGGYLAARMAAYSAGGRLLV